MYLVDLKQSSLWPILGKTPLLLCHLTATSSFPILLFDSSSLRGSGLHQPNACWPGGLLALEGPGHGGRRHVVHGSLVGLSLDACWEHEGTLWLRKMTFSLQCHSHYFAHNLQTNQKSNKKSLVEGWEQIKVASPVNSVTALPLSWEQTTHTPPCGVGAR